MPIWRKHGETTLRGRISKLSDSEAEAAETQTWIQLLWSVVIFREAAATLYSEYDAILGMLIQIIIHPQDWTL